MTNDELSIKVAELRGMDLSNACFYRNHLGFHAKDNATGDYIGRIEECATDMNEAWKLAEEADTWEMHRDANNPETIICTLVFNMTPFRARARTQSRSICKAYIFLKIQQ